jgi:hypothetical protein
MAEHLQPKMMKPMRDAMTKNWLLGDLQFGSNADDLVATLDCGDNFTVSAPPNNCQWGTNFEIGNIIVFEKYYQM